MIHITNSNILGCVVLLAGAGCGIFEREAVDPRAAAGVVVVNNDPPPTCRYIGSVSGEKILGDLAAAHEDLVKNAVVMGGNYVQIDMTERRPGGYGLQGRLFACAAAPPPVVPKPVEALEVAKVDVKELVSKAPIPASKVCEPDCSPGYSCVQGACVSACNPACAKGERCSSDRTCHALAPEQVRSAENHHPDVVESVRPNRGGETAERVDRR